MINHDEIYAEDISSGNYVSPETERLAQMWERNEEGDLTGIWILEYIRQPLGSLSDAPLWTGDRN